MKTHTISISDIVIPNGRFREAKGSRVQSIAASMLKFGQLQPIILDRDMRLVDGLHRLTAAKANGFNVIEAVFRDEADSVFLREIELEVNIQREEMTWLEREKAIAELHQLRVQQDPNWGQTQTQQLIGSDRRSDVTDALKLVRMIEVFPEIAKAKNKAQAMSWAEHKASQIMRVVEVKNNKADFGPIEERVVLGDSVEVIKTIPDEMFNAVITDPPFGIDYDRRSDGEIGTLSAYEDSAESYERLLSMAPDLYRVIKPDGWLIWFLGISWYERAKTVFRQVGFIVDEIPIIWDRSEGRCFTTRPDRYFGRAYDIALHCIKGNPQVVQRSKPNIIRVAPVGTSERELLVERPVELYAELIRRLTLKGESVADFFVGSGSCLAAAAKLQREYFGVELDPERRAYAIKKIKAYTQEEEPK
jgi:DNA modification methylase/ParB-like chromosome segregation protein Spo0J